MNNDNKPPTLGMVALPIQMGVDQTSARDSKTWETNA
jgi:hypothetical protein